LTHLATVADDVLSRLDQDQVFDDRALYRESVVESWRLRAGIAPLLLWVS
jgi:hypothetical protein